MMNQLERHLLVVVAGRFVDEHELADSMDRHFAANTYIHIINFIAININQLELIERPMSDSQA